MRDFVATRLEHARQARDEEIARATADFDDEFLRILTAAGDEGELPLFDFRTGTDDSEDAAMTRGLRSKRLPGGTLGEHARPLCRVSGGLTVRLARGSHRAVCAEPIGRMSMKCSRSVPVQSQERCVMITETCLKRDRLALENSTG